MLYDFYSNVEAKHKQIFQLDYLSVTMGSSPTLLG